MNAKLIFFRNLASSISKKFKDMPNENAFSQNELNRRGASIQGSSSTKIPLIDSSNDISSIQNQKNPKESAKIGKMEAKEASLDELVELKKISKSELKSINQSDIKKEEKSSQTQQKIQPNQSKSKDKKENLSKATIRAIPKKREIYLDEKIGRTVGREFRNKRMMYEELFKKINEIEKKIEKEALSSSDKDKFFKILNDRKKELDQLKRQII